MLAGPSGNYLLFPYSQSLPTAPPFYPETHFPFLSIQLLNQTGSFCVSQAGLELTVFLPHPPSVGITDVNHYAWFTNDPFLASSE